MLLNILHDIEYPIQWNQPSAHALHKLGSSSIVNSVATIIIIRAVLSYSAKRYDSPVCCSKISCNAFLSEALYEADKALKKFAAVPEYACL